MYSSTKDQEYKDSADYQEIDTPVHLSPNHYEMEHIYECSDALDFPYYAEVGPLLDKVGSQEAIIIAYGLRQSIVVIGY